MKHIVMEYPKRKFGQGIEEIHAVNTNSLKWIARVEH